MLKNPENEQPRTIHLADYKPTPFIVTKIELHFELDAAQTSVKSKLSICRNDLYPDKSTELQLHGQDLILKGLILDGEVLRDQDYKVDDTQLSIFNIPDKFVLEVQTEISPIENTTLNGLYLSSGNFCTQCEAEGFRHITYMYDRPDVMARYTTTIVADPVKFPILLSNGNCVERGTLGDGRHWVKWEDPFPKPTYLFALVAGDLACIEDHFVTRSGRKVLLQIFVEHHNKDKCQHAMHSLINAMRWDEKVFGREYDLDIYMIVAVDDFNMGAMENKGLNVFNSKYVLAKPETATDGDYQGIEGVIGHEYFHNWSGNRVTCRDWFQLSLKEGFTVFRDQQFSADMSSKGVKRIQDVNILRSYQFREDAGPMAHPVRPESYVEINNFYTMTVYNKGAEVVRMLFHLLGEDGFRKGTDLYFSRHDGQAVTTDDFVKAMEDANEQNLTQFKLWYSQAGTPVLNVSADYNVEDKTYTLIIKQSCPDTPGQSQKQAFYIPISIGLLGSDGKDLPLQLQGEAKANTDTQTLHLKEFEQKFIFVNVPQKPVPSLLRSYSAPVKLQIDLSDDERCFLMANDKDDFNRWDAGQQLAIKIIIHLVNEYQNGRELLLDEGFIAAYKKILLNKSLDKSLAAQALTLPAETYISDFIDPIDPEAVHEVRCFVRKQLAAELKSVFYQIYEENIDQGPYKIDQLSIARRKLKNCALGYLMELGDETIIQNCVVQFKDANNMTDVLCALSNLVNNCKDERGPALQKFYDKWRKDPLVVDKWLGLQAASRLPGALSNVKKLIQHESFTIKNPNKVRALIGGFCSNLAQFHAKNGEGYRFIGDYVTKIDALNPQISSRLVNVFTLWKKYDPDRQKLMKEQLEKIISTPNLSKDVHEIVSKSLL